MDLDDGGELFVQYQITKQTSISYNLTSFNKYKNVYIYIYINEKSLLLLLKSKMTYNY